MTEPSWPRTPGPGLIGPHDPLRWEAWNPADTADAPDIEAFEQTVIAGVGATSVTVNVPAGTTAGHMLLVAVAWRAQGAITPSEAGWTEHGDANQVNGPSLAIYTRIVAGGDPSSYTFTSAAAASRVVATCARVNKFTGIDAFQISTGSSITPTAPSVTSTGSERLLVNFYANNGLEFPTFVAANAEWNISSGGAAGGAVDSAAASKRFYGGATGTRPVPLAVTQQWAAASMLITPGPPVTAVADVQITLSDSGSGADSLDIGADVPLGDSGTGADSLAVAADVPLLESGSGTDTLQVEIPKTLTDSGSGTDSLSVAAAVTLADSGTGTDALPQVIERALSSADATTGSGVATTLQVSPTGQQVGDWLIAEVASVGGASTPSAPDGTWTQVGTTQTANNVTVISVWTKKVTATGESYTFTLHSANRRGTLSVRAFYGIDPNATSPIEGTPIGVTASAASSLTHSSQTVAAMGDLWVLATAKSFAAAGSSTMNTASGFTETADQSTSHATLSNCNAGMQWEPDGPGPTGTQLVDSSDGTNTNWVGVGFILSPTPVVATQKTLEDSGSGSDSLSVAAAVPLADSGTGSDAVTIAAAVPLGDSGSGADSIQIAIPKTLTDSGTGADSLSIAAAVPLAEAGTGSDTLAVSAAVTLTDSGTGTESIAVGIPKTLTDSGSATDSLTVQATVPLSESGSGSDALAAAAAVSLRDSGTGVDSIQVAQQKILTDSGTGVDSLRVAASVPLADSGTATDTAFANALLSLLDSGLGVDSIEVNQLSEPVTVRTGPGRRGGPSVGNGDDGPVSIGTSRRAGPETGDSQDSRVKSGAARRGGGPV